MRRWEVAYIKAGGLYHPIADWSSNAFSCPV